MNIKRIIGKAVGIFCAVILFVSALMADIRPAYAQCSPCTVLDCLVTRQLITSYHVQGEAHIDSHIDTRFEEFKEWMVEEFFTNNLLVAMMMMTEQLSAVGMQQMLGVGMIFDAKDQLETQRLFQQLQVETVKTYFPSEELCYFGTNVRSLAHAESKSKATALGINAIAMARQTGEFNNAGAQSASRDKLSRWKKFQTRYCNPYNNGFDPQAEDAAGLPDRFTGLAPACELDVLADQADNLDVDYQRSVDARRTINMDLTDNTIDYDPNAQNTGPVNFPEDDIFSLMKNLYGHELVRRDTGYVDRKSGQFLYLGLRTVMARRNVAQNSFNHIAALKTKHEDSPNVEYMRAILKNLGIEPTEENYMEILGENPSYYAQLEALSKRLYQNQNFYPSLYDNPQNVERTGVALRAIDLMLEREKFESRIRQEMLISVLLSTKLINAQTAVSDNMQAAIDFEEAED